MSGYLGCLVTPSHEIFHVLALNQLCASPLIPMVLVFDIAARQTCKQRAVASTLILNKLRLDESLGIVDFILVILAEALGLRLARRSLLPVLLARNLAGVRIRGST